MDGADYTVEEVRRLYVMSTWMRRGAGYQPEADLATRDVAKLRRVDVVDRRTGEPAGSECRGKDLRVLGQGGCTLFMAATFRKHTVRARRNALQGVHSGVVPPMLRTAEAMALTEHDAQSAIDMVGSSEWDAPTTPGTTGGVG
eukprot:COSAG02_NODE_5851_length_3989_cov_1.620308_5_plen_143_part_00